LNPAPA